MPDFDKILNEQDEETKDSDQVIEKEVLSGTISKEELAEESLDEKIKNDTPKDEESSQIDDFSTETAEKEYETTTESSKKTVEENQTN